MQPGSLQRGAVGREFSICFNAQDQSLGTRLLCNLLHLPLEDYISGVSSISCSASSSYATLFNPCLWQLSQVSFLLRAQSQETLWFGCGFLLHEGVNCFIEDKTHPQLLYSCNSVKCDQTCLSGLYQSPQLSTQDFTTFWGV